MPLLDNLHQRINKRLLCHVKVEISHKANCLPLENITLLNTQRCRTLETLNTTTGLTAITMANGNVSIDPDHVETEDSDFVSCMPWIPDGMESVIKSIIEYIWGYVVKKNRKEN